MAGSQIIVAQQNEKTFKEQWSRSSDKKPSIYSCGIISAGAVTIAVHSPILWIGVIYLGFILASRLSGLQVAGRSFSMFNSDVDNTLRTSAGQVAKDSCAKDISGLERHFSSFASLADSAPLPHPSTIAKNKWHVASPPSFSNGVYAAAIRPRKIARYYSLTGKKKYQYAFATVQA